MSQPTTLPALLRDAIASAAVEGVRLADGDDPENTAPGVVKRRNARLFAMESVHGPAARGEIVGLDKSASTKLAQGLNVLLDAAEDLTHGVVGEITDAGIAAAQRKAHCACGPTFVGILKALLDIGVQAAFAGIRAAT